MKKMSTKLAIAGALMVLAVQANASLVGDDVVIKRIADPFILAQTTVTVGDGYELYSFQNWAIDIQESSIYMLPLAAIGYTDKNYFQYEDLEFGSPDLIITGVHATGIDEQRVMFGDHWIRLDFSWGGFAWPNPINLAVTTGTSVTPVPLPGTLLFMVSGLIALVAGSLRPRARAARRL